MNGVFFGADSISRRAFGYAYVAATVIVGVICTLNILSIAHEMPHLGFLEPVIWEYSSWISLVAFFWIVWAAWRIAPWNVRPRWRLLVHVPAALLFSLAHVGGFIALRALAYRALGSHYGFGHFWPQFFYELRKDSFGYVMFLAGFALIEHLLRQQPVQPSLQTLTFDIRDGAKLTRVKLSDILAVTSAGNYVEFALADGRRLMMRSPLSAIENDLAGRGFVRTHRSWLVNAARVTALKPEGSGDYEINLGTLAAPLSRRFKAALVTLRATPD